MSKVYFIYAAIPEKDFSNRIKYLVPNYHDYRCKHNHMYGLYAWTFSRNVCDEFLETRGSQMYTVIRKDIYGKEEKDRIKKDLAELKLDYYTFSAPDLDEKKVQIITTKSEYVNSVDYASENIYEFGPASTNMIKPDLLNNDLLDALKELGFVTDYIVRFCIDDYEVEKDDKTMHKSLLWELASINQIAMFLYLYKVMFCEEIREE